MISYDKYQNRIKRVAAVKNFIVRFRWPFIALFAVLIAASLALMFTKGMITQSIILPEKIIYGDSYGAEIQPPKAFLSDVEYQFKRIKDENDSKSAVKHSLTDGETEEEDEWTYDLPTYAGRYLVRMVSNKIFGKSYSSPQEFKIETKSIDFVIKSNRVVYGELPENYDFSTVKGDSFDTDAVRFNYEDPAADSTIVWADKDSFKIYNSKGEDVTFCYNISTPKTEEEVEIEQKTEEITPASLQTVYIGSEIDYENGVIHFKGGDAHFKTEIYDKSGKILEGNPVDAGTYTVKISEWQVFNGDVDVSNHYNINKFTATITVDKRPVTVITESATKEYDGKPLKATSVETDGLIEGHVLDAKLTENAINAGSYQNKCDSITISDKEEEVTSNYEITYSFGTLEITRRKITLTTRDYEKVYDGTAEFPLDKSSYTITNLVSEHTPDVTFTNKISNVGSYSNAATLTVKDGEGNDITRNYEISYDFGTLEILPRAIKVTTPDGSWDYDGTPHFNNAIEKIELVSKLGEGANALADDEVISVEKYTEITYFTAEEVKNEFVCKIYNKSGVVTTRNYVITPDCGALKINPVDIEIENKPYERAYNGTPLQGYGTEVKPVATWLMGNDSLVPVNLSEIIDVGEIDNKTTYKIVNSAGVDITDSYKISYIGNAKLKITQAQLTINTPDVTKVYDGTPLSGADGVPTFSGKAPTDYYEAYDATEQTDADSVKNETQYNFYAVRGGEKVPTTGNYVINYTDHGYVTVTQRPIGVKTSGETRQYDGTPLKNTGFEEKQLTGYAVSGLIKGHVLEVEADSAPSVTDVGRIENRLYFKILNNGEPVTDNYDFTYTFGWLEVTPRVILVTTDSTADGEWIYYGGEFSKGSETYVHGSGDTVENFVPDTEAAFVRGHKLELVSAREVVDAGEYDNICTYRVVDENSSYDEKIAANYNVLVKYGTLKVNPRPVSVKTDTKGSEYDGQPFSYTELEYVESFNEANRSGILSIHTAKFNPEEAPATVTTVYEGKVSNVFKVKIVDKNDESVTDNYKISYEYGEIYITARPITITTATLEKVYDGIPLKGNDISGTYGAPTKITGLVEGEYAVASFIAELTDCDVATNNTQYEIYRTGSGKQVLSTENYKVETYSAGTLTVTRRTIWVVSGYAQKEYDGAALTCGTGWTVTSASGLVLDHTLDATKLTSITDVVRDEKGEVISVPNKVEFRVVDGKGNAAVNDNYTIKYFNEYGEEAYGTLKVTPRIIRVTTDNGEWTYDAEWHFKNSEKCEHGSFTSDGTFVPSSDKTTFVSNHHLERLSARSEKDAGRYENVCTYDVYDASDNSVISNYEIRVVYGELYIKPRPITITTATVEEEYDGKAHSSDEFTYEEFKKAEERGLVEWHSVKLAPNQTFKSVTNVLEGKILNEFDVEIFDKSENVTKNYKIEYKNGTLSVTPRIVLITTDSMECPYDGQEHSKPSEVTVHGRLTVNGIMPDSENAALVSGHRLERVKITKVIDAGEYDNVIEYEVRNGSEEVTSNYDLNVVNGKIIITKLKLTITTATLEKVYDGTPLMGDDGSGRYGKPAVIEGLAETDFTVAYPEAQMTNYGTTSNDTQYEIRRRTESGTSVVATQNYDPIEYKYGTLTITKRTIWVVSGSAQKEYDGTPLIKLDGWTITGAFDADGNALETGLVSGHTLKAVEYNASFTDVVRADKNDPKSAVLSIDNVVKYIVVNENDATFDVNGNYIIEYLNGRKEEEYGKLTITPRKITVKTATDDKEYDGKPLTNTEDAYTTYGSLVKGHSLYVREGVYVASVTNVYEGVVPNRIDEYSVRGAGGDVTGNYDVEVDGEYGTLTILPRKISITLNKVEDFEYGDEFTGYPEVNGRMFSYASGSKQTVEGETLVITVRYRYLGADVEDVYGKLSVGTYTVMLNTAEIDGGSIENYDISPTNSTFEVLKRKITIYLLAPDGGEKEYDGKELVFDGTVNNGYELAAGSTLAYDDELTIEVRYLSGGMYIGGKPIDAGEYTIELDLARCIVSDGAEEPSFALAASSYEITCNTVDYVITPRMLLFDVHALTHEYMGVPVYHFEDDLVSLSEETPLVGSDVLTDIDGTILLGDADNAIDVGVYSYIITGVTILRGDKDISGNYYISKDQPMATIEIVQRKITVRVHFEDTASREYTGEEIDLIEEYKPYGQLYGPYKSEPVNEGIEDYGIFSGDLNKIQAKFTAWQNDAVVDLINLGDYYITVSLSDKEGYEVLKNYDITYEGDEFSITRRQIIVMPKMTAKERLVYNGEKLNTDYLDYDTQHYFSDTEGLFDESHKEYFKATYFLYYTKSPDVNVIGEILQAGTYKLLVELQYITEKEDEVLYDIVEYLEFTFTVDRRPIFANTPDDLTDYVYNKTAANTPEEYTMYYDDNGWQNVDSVYIANDFAGAVPEYGYFKNGLYNESAVDAGTYQIVVSSYEGATAEQTEFIKRNYEVRLFADGYDNGILTIRPAKLVVVPIAEYSEKYDGSNEIIGVPQNGYIIKYGQLFGDDKLTFTASGVLNIRKSIAARITFTAIHIADGRGDVTENYEIAYTYAQLKEVCPELVGTLTQADFGTILSFEQISISVRQPKSSYQSVEYGTNMTITVAEPDITDYVIEDAQNPDRLLDGHRVIIATARVIAAEMSDITQWIYRCKVVDDKGDITFGYNINIVCESDSYIGVTERVLTIEVPPRSELKAGDVLEEGAYRITQGNLYYGAIIEITVNESGECVANITTRFGEDHNDRYIVNFEYSEENNQKEAEYASRIQLLLSRRTEIIRKDDLSQ